MKVYISGNYIIFEGERLTHEFAMKWTIFKFNQTTATFILNEFTGGTLKITARDIENELIVDENDNPFTIGSLYNYLLNHTGL
jgi:hypothetical protein